MSLPLWAEAKERRERPKRKPVRYSVLLPSIGLHSRCDPASVQTPSE